MTYINKNTENSISAKYIWTETGEPKILGVLDSDYYGYLHSI